MIGKVHHVAIICSDYKKSKQFYVDILGLEVIQETYRNDRASYKLDLSAGNIQIELFSFPNPPDRKSYPEAAGLRHLAFEVDNIAIIVEYLKDQNIQVEELRIDPLTDKKFTFFADPDQLPIEIYEK